MTAACTDCRSLLGGYVLNALESGEAEAVRRHLAACDGCASEHGQLTGIPALLDVAGGVERPTEQPPAALEEAVLDRFARETPGGRGPREQAAPAGPEPHRGRPLRDHLRGRLRTARRSLTRPLPAALSGALAAAAVTAALVTIPGGDDAKADVYRASLTGTSAIPAASADAELKVFSSGTHVDLSVRGLRGQPDSVYELWCIRDDGVKISAGTFRTDSSGRADVALTTAAIPGEYHRMSVERKAFRSATGSGERVMAGEIHYPRW